MPVPIVVEKGTAGSPAAFLLIQARFLRHIGKGAIAVVMEEYVLAPEGAEEVIPAIVVVVAHANAGLPSASAQARFRGNVGKCAVAIVFIEVRGGRGAGSPVRIQPAAVSEIDVEP